MDVNEIVTKLENDLRKKADNFFYITSEGILINRLNFIALSVGPYSPELAKALSQTVDFLVDTRKICDRILLEKNKSERKQHDKLGTDA